MEQGLQRVAGAYRRAPVAALLAVAVVAVAVVLAGCGGSGGGAKDDVEAMIGSQLPGSVMRNTGEAVFVNEVTCVEKGGGGYDCVASVTGTDGAGGTQQLDVPVTASCDDENCTWRSG
jgi:hypothetical protein